MSVKIEDSWKQLLNSEFNKNYFKELISFVKSEYSSSVCYPKGSEIFSAFDNCPINKLKAVIIGQDPYHGPNQANGLCFSVNKGIVHPPSLINIFKELEDDIGKKIDFTNGNLEHWAKQGVFLLNTTLTVERSRPLSHQNLGWNIFTDKVISTINKSKENIVFILWGSFAQSKKELIDSNKHLILTALTPLLYPLIAVFSVVSLSPRQITFLRPNKLI